MCLGSLNLDRPSCLFQVESIETALNSVQQWIDKGIALMDSHKVDGNINDVEERLQNHTV